MRLSPKEACLAAAKAKAEQALDEALIASQDAMIVDETEATLG